MEKFKEDDELSLEERCNIAAVIPQIFDQIWRLAVIMELFDAKAELAMDDETDSFPWTDTANFLGDIQDVLKTSIDHLRSILLSPEEERVLQEAAMKTDDDDKTLQ